MLVQRRFGRLPMVAATLALLVVAAQPALADRPTGPYIGGSIGASFWDVDDTDILAIVDGSIGDQVIVDNEDLLWGALLGWQITETWGIEAAYMDLGRIDGKVGSAPDISKFEVTGYRVVGTGRRNTGLDWLDFVASIGLFIYDADIEAQVSDSNRGFDDGASSSSPSGEAFTFGLGLEADLTDNLDFRVEYNHYRDIEDIDNNAIVASVTFSLTDLLGPLMPGGGDDAEEGA